MFVYEEFLRRKIKDNSVDLHKMAHFATHTSNAFELDSCCVSSSEFGGTFQRLSDSLNNIARQNRTKRKENLESIACAEGQWFVLHSNRAAF